MANLFIQSSETEMTPELLKALIDAHKALVPGYQKLKQYYEGQHPILFEKDKDTFKPDNRLVVNFAKYIVDTLNGYFCGVPIKVSHENQQVQEYLDLLDAYNDQDDNNSELSKICSIYGHGYELVYADENAQIGITYLDPMEAFIVYDDSIRRNPLFAVRYFLNSDEKLEGSFSDARAITYFTEGDDGLVFGEVEAHNFEGVPMIEYVENEEKRGAFESVQTLIDAFNKVLSEKANDVDYFADSYLKVLGAHLDETTLKSLRDTRIINMFGDGAEKMDVSFLTKPDADQTQENLLSRIQGLIFQIAMVANISDENFGDTSGVALRYKLQPMENLAKSKERKFVSGMTRRYRLISSFPGSKLGQEDWLGIRYNFTRNVPANLLEETEIAKNLAGIVSEETQISVLSIVDNPAEEAERKTEKVESLTRSGGLNGAI